VALLERRPIRRKKRKTPRYFKILLTGVAFCLFCAFFMSCYQIWQVQADIQQVKSQRQLLLEEQQRLEKELAALQDPEVIEKLARESLGMVKPGEILVVPAVPEEQLPERKEVDVTKILD